MDLDIRQFNEWKQSPDFLVQTWFTNKKNTVKDWFATPAFKDITFDYFEFSESDANGIYLAQTYFSEGKTQYCLEMVIDADDVIDGLVSQITVNLKGYAGESNEMLGVKTEPLDEPSLTADKLIDMIAEFKTNYIDTEK